MTKNAEHSNMKCCQWHTRSVITSMNKACTGVQSCHGEKQAHTESINFEVNFRHSSSNLPSFWLELL